MSTLLNELDNFTSDYFGFSIPDVGIIDVIEILIIAFAFYKVMSWLRNTKAWSLFKGMGVVVAFFLIAGLFQMHTILWIGEKLLSAALVGLVVLFQPEIRAALERLGRNGPFSWLKALGMSRPREGMFSDKTLQHLVLACYEMGRVKTGALIVIEGDNQLNAIVRTGIEVDGIVTKQLLINIFEKNTPLHDGAVVIRGDRVVAATCYLPLSENMALSKDLGTRHRAGLGMSEVSDAMVLIVSEETGLVSIAYQGRLIHGVSADTLEESLRMIQRVPEASAEETPLKEDDHEAEN